ncbi:MAG: ABC transporter substrate-binding protein, partial [Promethearchaeota archaeon]
MKQKTKKSVFFLTILMITAFIPLVTAYVPKTSQASRSNFIWTGGTGVIERWDPAIVDSTDFECLERLLWIDQHQTAHPMLALDWTFHSRPDEGNMTGGVAAISMNLRQGVTFHDGSEFNATVVKWNVDRVINISAFVDQKWYGRNWFNPSGLESRYTSTWNLSWAGNDPFGTGGFIPFINETIVVSEYVVNFTLNKWALDVFYSMFSSSMGNMISMESYKPWQWKAIYGYGEDPGFPQDDPGTFVGHLIGTGAYKFEYIDSTVTQLAKASKNLDYWNRTALEAAGRLTIDDIFFRFLTTPDLRTNALRSGEVDGAAHMLQQPLTDVPGIIDDPLLSYYPTIFDPSIAVIQLSATEGFDTPVIGVPNKIGSLSGVNYTTLEGMTPREMFPTIAEDYGWPAGTELPLGFNRTVRRALSYAYDYQSWLNATFTFPGSGIWTTSPFGMGSIYYDPSVPHPYYDITRAREIMLADPYYAAKLAERGLGLANDSATWKYIGQTNPIQVFSVLNRPQSTKVPFLEDALNNIGFAITQRMILDMYRDWMSPGKAVGYDAWVYTWLNSATEPFGFFGSGMNLLYHSKSRRIPFNLFNFHHIANDTIDSLMTEIPFAGTNAQNLANQLTEALLNYHAPWVYLAQGQFGVAANSGWKIGGDSLEFAGPSGVEPNFAWIGGAREVIAPPSPPEIPGYSVGLTLLSITVASVAFV